MSVLKNNRKELWEDLYLSVFPQVARFIAKNDGNLEEARDVFQEALVVFHEKQHSESIHDIKAFVYGTARFIWYRRFGERNKYNLTDEDTLLDYAYVTDDPSPSESRLINLLEKAGKKCLELLKAFYYDKLSMTQIAKMFGFSGERSATVQKYKCLEKVRDQVKEKQLHYEDFYE